MAAPVVDRTSRPSGGEPAPAATTGTGGDGLAWLVAGALALVAARPYADNSFLTHLATGRILVEDGFPDTNPFLYSSTDFPIPSWWWSGITALAESVAGGAGIRLVTAAVAALVGATIVRLTRPVPVTASGAATTPSVPGTGDQSLLAVLVPSLLAGLCLLPFLTPRPHLAGFLLLGVSLLLWRERRSPWWLVPVFATWVNLHGTWLYGLVVLGLYAACEAIDARRLEPRRFAPVAAGMLGVVLGGLLYPERLRLVLLPFEQFGDERARDALASYREWVAPGLDHPLSWVVISLGAAAAVGAWRGRFRATAVGAVLLVAMGLSAGRLLPVAAISLVPWAAVGLAGVGTLARPSGRAAAVVRGVGVAALVMACVSAVRAPHEDLSAFPVAAVDWLDDRGLAGRPDVRVVSHDFVGNYLGWRYGADANTWVDDRPGVDAALDYVTVNRLRPGWAEALERADGDVVVWKDDAPLTDRLAGDPDWVRAASIDGFTVFCRAPIADRCR